MNNIDMGRIGRCLELPSSIVHTITIFFGEIFPSTNLVSLTLSKLVQLQVNVPVNVAVHLRSYTNQKIALLWSEI
jgi:hypothetical protein